MLGREAGFRAKGFAFLSSPIILWAGPLIKKRKILTPHRRPIRSPTYVVLTFCVLGGERLLRKQHGRHSSLLCSHPCCELPARVELGQFPYHPAKGYWCSWVQGGQFFLPAHFVDISRQGPLCSWGHTQGTLVRFLQMPTASLGHFWRELSLPNLLRWIWPPIPLFTISAWLRLGQGKESLLEAFSCLCLCEQAGLVAIPHVRHTCSYPQPISHHLGLSRGNLHAAVLRRCPN